MVLKSRLLETKQSCKAACACGDRFRIISPIPRREDLESAACTLLKAYVVLFLFVPYYNYPDNAYTTTLIVPNIGIVIASVLIAFIPSRMRTIGDISTRVIATALTSLYGIMVSLAVIFGYMPAWTIVNQVLPFVFAGLVLLRISPEAIQNSKLIPFVQGCLFVSILISLILYLDGIEAIHFSNGTVPIRRQGVFSDVRLSYIYSHKSTYGLVLVLYLASIFECRQTSHKFIQSVVAISALLAVNSLVSTIAAFLIFLVELIQRLSRKKRFNGRIARSILLGILLLCAISFFLFYATHHRNLQTVGNRFPIWLMALRYFSDNPTGLFEEMGLVVFPLEGFPDGVDNFHNVFLNAALQYSLPVGVVFSALVLLFVCQILRCKKKRWMCFVLVVAILLPMMMDNAFQARELPFILFLIVVIIKATEFAEIKPSKSESGVSREFPALLSWLQSQSFR